MPIRNVSARLNIVNILRNIRDSSCFLSVSTRGVESEVNGWVASVKQTVRGLTLTLTNGKKVLWNCPASLAKSVVERYTSSAKYWPTVFPQ